MEAEMFECEHLARAAHAALDFIRNQENAVLSRYFLELGKKIRRRKDIAAFTLNGLDDDRRDFAWIDRRSENDIFQISRITERDVSNTGNKGTESLPLYRLRRRQG